VAISTSGVLVFPTGISGLDLTARAYAQAQKFGAQIMIAKGATGLARDRTQYAVTIDGGPRVPARGDHRHMEAAATAQSLERFYVDESADYVSDVSVF
jgi:hypothetical protein